MSLVKKFFFWIILIAVAILLIIQIKNYTPDSEPEKSEPVFSISADEISGISWNFDGEALSFTKTDEEWYLSDDESFPVNQVLLDAMESSLSDLLPTETIPDANPLSYGIDENAFKISVTKTDNTLIELFFSIPDGDQNYCMKTSQSDNIYVLPGNIVKDFSYRKADLLQKESIPNMENAFCVTVAQKGKTIKLSTNSETGKWESSGITLPDDQAELLKIMLSTIEWGECVNYNATAKDLNSYGLSSPLATVTVETPDSAVVFEIGNEINDGYYIKLENSKMVYIVSAESFGIL